MATGFTSPKNAGYNVVQTPRMSPEVKQMWDQLRGGASGGVNSSLDQLSKMAGGDQSQFDQMEAPALRQFGALQGSLGSRFSGMGSGARKSSGFQNTTSGAAGDLAERLQGNRMQFQQGAQDRLMSLYQDLMGNDPYEYSMTQKKKPFWQELLLGLAGGASQGLGTMGGMWGAKKLGIF